MLEKLNQINWKKISDESNHSYIFVVDTGEDYSIIPNLLRGTAEGVEEAYFELSDCIFGEQPHDMDAKLYELVLPFVWEIYLGSNPIASVYALELICEGYERFYQMKYAGDMELLEGEHGIANPPEKLLGNDASAAFTKLKADLNKPLPENYHRFAINILSLIPDYHDETIVIFQNLLGKGSLEMDEIILSGLGRLLYHYKLPITADFQNYLDSAPSETLQGMAAFWTIRLQDDKNLKRAASQLLELGSRWTDNHRENGWLGWSDYWISSYPEKEFMKRVRELAEQA